MRVERSYDEVNVLYYEGEQNETGEALERVIKSFVPGNHIEICQTVEGLKASLCRPMNDLDLGVLLITRKEELERLLSISDVLGDLDTIVILPDREKSTVAKGHMLKPRFLTYVDADYLEIAAVLSKRMAKEHFEKSVSLEAIC